MNNLLLTGSRGSGKTTTADLILKAINLPCAGFRTVQAGNTPAGPLYNMVNIQTGEFAPISCYDNKKICGLPNTFLTFGTDLLLNALHSDASLFLMDEIGRFEQNCPSFLNAVWNILESDIPTIVVLKKENLPHIARIRARQDSLLFDLDYISPAQIMKKIYRKFI